MTASCYLRDIYLFGIAFETVFQKCVWLEKHQIDDLFFLISDGFNVLMSKI